MFCSNLPITQKAPRGSHCGGEEACCQEQPAAGGEVCAAAVQKHAAGDSLPQAENPAEQDSMPYTKNRKFCSGFSVIYPDIINKKRREKT